MDAVAKARELAGSPEFMFVSWQQFNHCQAWTGRCKGYTLIKSYNTIVGIVDEDEGVMYELGKYSRTTSKQITQIHNQIFPYTKRELVERIA